MSAAIYESVTGGIIEALQRGVIPWRKPWSPSSSMPVNAFTKRPYRGINVILLSLSPFSDHRWLSFLQVKELGGFVRSGEHATQVVFWKQWEVEDTDTEGKVSWQTIPILKVYSVFNADQCVNLNLPDLSEPDPKWLDTRIERAETAVKAMPDPPHILLTGDFALYRPSTDTVQVPPMARFLTADHFYAAIFHELGHSTGHSRRLNRSGVTGKIQLGSGEYSQEELIAELTSAFCAATLSLNNELIGHSASYIDSWVCALRGDSRLVVTAAAQAQRAADYIFGVPI